MTRTDGQAREGMGAAPAHKLLLALLMWVCIGLTGAFANDRAQLIATNEDGYARLILSFADRLDLPAYKIKSDNGVLSITFDQPVDMTLPDIAGALPDYITIARMDPDRMGIRFGLRNALTVNRIEAGEKLFVDLLPQSWQGLPPSLPQQVVDELSLRAKNAAMRAEQQRKAEEAKRLKPTAELRLGRNPTFLRLQFDWNVPTKGSYSFANGVGSVKFDWPVPVDVAPLEANMPAELTKVTNQVGPDGSVVTLTAAKGVTPRFYATSDHQFIVDIDLVGDAAGSVSAHQLLADQQHMDAAHGAVTETQRQMDGSAPAPQADHGAGAAHGDGAQPHQEAQAAEGQRITPPNPLEAFPSTNQASITPYVNQVGQTVRLVFPFDQDTPAAVFRRGNTVWMLFDTLTGINQPDKAPALASIMKDFTVLPSGGTQVVRVDLSGQQLATLGSEGRAWVLSLGDIMLTATEPMTLDRRQDDEGFYEMTADLDRPGKVHQFRDPEVGDLLTVVTAFPPARGMTRDLSYVDFTALRSVHGLVIKPQTDNVHVGLDGKLAVISAPGGLVVSALDRAQAKDSANPPEARMGYINLNVMHEDDPTKLNARREDLMDAASRTDGEARDRARLDLARFYVANQFGQEALGVLDVAQPDLKSTENKAQAQRYRAVADILAARPQDAIAILNTPTLAAEADSLMWRAIARADHYDFRGARADAIASETVVSSYPQWVRTRFYLAASRAAVETGDAGAALHDLGKVDFAKLEGDDVTLYQLLQGRVAEIEGKYDDALDTYGQVIAADVRPTRAEAIYRTMLVLDKEGRLDLDKGADTLASETMMWRGNPLEADMEKLLAELYFRKADYRAGFDTVKSAVGYFPESVPIVALQQEAKTEFSDLFLNGRADSLDPITALGIYYDFRGLTPPGAQGDQMIRNLAGRLIKLDLLGQAADLLKYQVDNRLTGAARAQVAADLAIVLIADRRPQEALSALHSTDMADLPPALQRQRRVLEARALIDGGRNDLALDLLSKMSGRDVDLMRIDANWNAKRYDQAAELLEQLYSEGTAVDVKSQMGRSNILKAATGYALANDSIGSSRLRAKFAEVMSQSAEWPMFDYLTGTVSTASLDFKKAVRDVAAVDSLGSFLSAYNQLYGGKDSMVPLAAKKPTG